MYLKQDSLPDEYRHLYNLKHPMKIFKNVRNKFLKQSCFVEGCYVSLVIDDQQLIDELMKHNATQPLVH